MSLFSVLHIYLYTWGGQNIRSAWKCRTELHWNGLDCKIQIDKDMNHNLCNHCCQLSEKIVLVPLQNIYSYSDAVQVMISKKKRMMMRWRWCKKRWNKEKSDVSLCARSFLLTLHTAEVFCFLFTLFPMLWCPNLSCAGDLRRAETQPDACAVANPPAAGHPPGGRGQERDQLHPPVCPQLPFIRAGRLVQQIHLHPDCRWV